MRIINQKPGFFHLSGLLLAVALFASPLAANAQTMRCELDWDCSGFVTFHDVYKHENGGLGQVKSTGFYADVYYYTVYHNTYPEYVDGGYFHEYMQCGAAGNMDWNGDGVIDMTDAYEGNPSAAHLDNFYTQFYVWEYYHLSYDYFYPNSDCVPDQPGSCEGNCGGFGGGANLIPCWCEEDCHLRGDGCCDDYEEECVEVNTCEGIGDDDGDGVCNDVDNCPDTPNPGQENTFGDTRGDACEPIVCDPGYEPHGLECVDIDECALGIDTCTGCGICVNRPGTFDCYSVTCDPGYQMVGCVCVDIDECAEGTDDCDPAFYSCENTAGYFNCNCIDSDGDGMCDIDDPCPIDPFNNCCQTATDCPIDEYCEIADETCGTDGQCAVLPVACDETAAPVCGCDGLVYFSECEADYADASVALLDVCASTVPCVDNSDCTAGEFCYDDGYCMAIPDNCPAGGAEFCGIDGLVHDNACQAAAAGTTLGICEGCQYHSECGPNEYCAGDGCGLDLTCDPFLPDGICTPIRDIAECATAGISPTCGCDSNFYLNECELEAAGVRYQGAGLCAPVSCTTDADCACGLSCIGDMAKQCLPT